MPMKARMLPMMLDKFPPAPGISVEMFKQAQFGPDVRPLKSDVVGDIGNTLWVLMGTIGVVLFIACANVANLMLVRAEGRQQELAIRAALGAGSSRIARELLIESVSLGLAGGALGVLLAQAALKLLLAMAPANLPRLDEISIDPRVLAFTLLISLAAGILFGLMPVFKYAGPHLAGGLAARRPRRERRPRTPPRAQCAGGGASGTGIGPAGRLRLDDPDHARARTRAARDSASPNRS